MATTLTNGVTTLQLPADLLWTDEFAWTPVAQTTDYSVAGTLLIDVASKQNGRPITVEGGSEHAWVTRATLVTLRQWADVPGLSLSLVLRGEPARNVVFDQARGPLDAKPIIDFSDPAAGDFYTLVLRFIET